MTVSLAMTALAQRTSLDQLRRQVAAVESGSVREEGDAVSTGVPALDALLPQGGLRRGSVVEWLSAATGGGAQTLALLSAREACREGKSLVVVDRLRQFYPPAAAAWGIDLARLIVIHPASEPDELWAVDQALRCRGVGAVWAKREQLDPRDFRRLQLAAESGGTLGLLGRSARVRGVPSWADVQLVVAPRPSTSGWRLHVELTRCRSSHLGQSVELEIDPWTGRVGQVFNLFLPISISGQVENLSYAEPRHETHPLRPAAELAPSAAGRLVAI